MASITSTLSIASSYRICIQSFDQLCSLLREPNCEFSSQISVLALEDELGRFRVWAGNVGAHRNGRISLDHRLREASQIHKKVVDLLKDLNEALRRAIAIASHERQPSDKLSWSSDSSVSSLDDGLTIELKDEMNSTTELQECFLEIAHVITCLYKFSIVLRNPAPRDRLRKCASIDVSHYEFFDIQHISHKFPNAEKYLVDRLGKTNSKRRQLFKYREKHHNKLTLYIDLLEMSNTPVDPRSSRDRAIIDEQGLTVTTKLDESLKDHSNIKKGPGTIATTVNTQTTVSTFVQGLPNNIEVCSDAGQSQTSYATSAGGDIGSKIHVPPPPKSSSSLDGSPFECPYCFYILIVRDSQSWMRHVFRDLQPYICTFKDCSKSDRLFGSRHDWYNHEVTVHRREWLCNACHQPFPTKALIENHLRQSHFNLFTETQLPAIVDRCERALESEQVCPLCREMYPARRLQSHLARHMQQLALFTLPRAREADGDSESAGAQASDSGGGNEGSLLDSTDLDFATNPSLENVDQMPDPQNETSDIEDEVHKHQAAKDPNSGEPWLESEEGPSDGSELAHQWSNREELEAQVIEEIKKILGQEHPDASANVTDLMLIYLNKEGSYGNVLQAAAGRGHEKLVQLLLEMGADVNAYAQGGYYGNALQAGAHKRHKKIVQLLIEKGADINAQGGYYGNALQAAVHASDEKIAQLLIEKGAYINAQGGFYGNALQAAANVGHEKLVRLLLDKGADVNAQGGKYGNPLQAAAGSGHVKLLQLLIENGADINAQGGYSGNALQAAAESFNKESVQLLLDKGADINAQGGHYGNALQAAAHSDNLKFVQLLLEKGANINARGGFYGNALYAAACEGYSEVVELLLKMGANPNAQGEHDRTPLEVASLLGYEEVVQILLEMGADVNAQGGDYEYALHAAAYEGEEEILRRLLDKGADVNAQGGFYGYALQAAADGGHEKVVQLLLELGANVNAEGGYYGNALQAAARSDDLGCVQLLLSQGANINAQGGYYGNALQVAAGAGNEKVVQLLLDCGSNVNAGGGYYGNALQAAADGGHEKIVQLLLESGANVNAQGGEYGNALQAAAHAGNEKLVQLLLDCGSDVNAQGGKFGDALGAAVHKNHHNIVVLLRAKRASTARVVIDKYHPELDQYELQVEFHEDYTVHESYRKGPTELEISAKWKKIADIGSGRFGVVSLQKEKGGELRAVKKVPLSAYNPQELETLVKLMRTQDKRLFVQLLGWYKDKLYRYIAMEYAEHGDLSKFIKSGSARSEARMISIQLLGGLSALNKSGICHRDLKPQDILVICLKPIWVKIADFGASEEFPSNLNSQDVLVSPSPINVRIANFGASRFRRTSSYTAPEIIEIPPLFHEVESTNALDLWSLGCIIHEILTSEPPFFQIPGSSDGTGLEASHYPNLNITLLLEYCQGTIELPTELLKKSGVAREGIKLVKGLLAANPSARTSAADGLKSPWLWEDETK